MKTRSVFSSIAVLALIACIFYPSAAQQSQQRLISRFPIEKDAPIEITDIQVNGKSISFDQKFFADDDWVKGLAISLKNKSNRKIIFASFQLFFPRQESTELVLMDELSYGPYVLLSRPPTAAERTVGIAPDETIDFKFPPNQLDGLKRFLIDANGSFQTANFRLGRVIFDDDSMWYVGGLFRRDDKNPSGWIHVHIHKS